MCKKVAFAVSRLSLLLFACFGFASGTAWAESGIRLLTNPPTMLDLTKPPCDAERITSFQVTIENVNCQCNEDVNPIQQATAVDGVLTNATPKDSFEFLGFTKTPGGALSPQITFIDMEDETSETFFFQVKTKPVPCGGGVDIKPFEKAEFGIVICDGGGGCDWGASTDLPYPVCESPKHIPLVLLQAAVPTSCPQPEGEAGTIQGKVTNSKGKPVVGAKVRAEQVACGKNIANKKTTTLALPLADKGEYTISGLPSPETYEMTVQEGGRCATATVTIPVEGGSVTQNFTLTAPCS